MLFHLHSAWAWVLVCGNGLAGLWALAAWRWPGLRTRALWWFVAFVQGAVLVQALLGAALMWTQGRSAPFFHYFYGVVAVVAVTLLYAYRRAVRRTHLLYGVGGLFVMGVGIRGLVQVAG